MHDPIKQKRWCTVHDREVERDEIVKGWEVAKGEFVVVEEADLEAIMQIDDSKSIEITRFVDAAEVDPVYFDRTYYLAPAERLRRSGRTCFCCAPCRRPGRPRWGGSSARAPSTSA